MLKRWQQLAEPSLTSCLQSIPGVYTRAEILQGVKEENEDDLLTSENDTDGKSSMIFCSIVHIHVFLVCLALTLIDRVSFSVEKYSPESPVPSL